MQSILNEIDEEWFIGYLKGQRFIEESGIRAETVRQFYKNKGIFPFAFRTESLGELCPYFLLNYTSAEQLNSLAGVRIYPSVGGFYINFSEEKTMEDIKKVLQSLSELEKEKMGIEISEFDIEDSDLLTAKIIYRYERSTKLFFPTNPIHVKIKISRTQDKKMFLVYGEIFRYLDFSRLRTFFASAEFKNKFELIDLHFPKINLTTQKHEIIKHQIESINSINLEIDGETAKFDLLGTYEHRANKADDLSPSNDIAYFKSSNKLNTETNIIEIESLIDQLQSQAGKGVYFLKCVYFSNSLKLYLSVSFYYDTFFFVTFNSLYKYPEEKKKLVHPSSKQELYDFQRKILEREEISLILSQLWTTSARKLFPSFNN